METPPLKRRRLAELAGLKHVSDRALASILGKLDDLGGVAAHAGRARGTIAKAVKADAMTPTTYGHLLANVDLPLASGGVYHWSVVHPAALLSWLCQVSASFNDHMTSLHAQKPATVASPWSIVVYVDEATAGNMLRQDPTRKSYLWFWQFAEFGPELLSREGNWFLGGMLRSNIAHNLAGGISCMFKHWVKHFFSPGASFHDGITCDGLSKVFVIKAALHTVLADADAMKAIWRFKGSSGCKPCQFCMNVVSSRSRHIGGRFVSVESPEVRSFCLHTDQTVWGAADHLAQLKTGTHTKKHFAEQEQMLGLPYHPEGVLWDHDLRTHVRPISASVTGMVPCVRGWGHC